MTDSPRSDHLVAQLNKARVGVVVIGRNEGERLARCLASIDRGHPIVYVDSGSDDGSPDLARKAGIDVVALDPAHPFTAARARNAGLDHLFETAPGIEYVQMIDGDCEMRPGWLVTAVGAIDFNAQLGAIFGRRRERFPDRSVYNWLCDVEWAVPRGQIKAFGGDVLLRRSAVEPVGGYAETMIAGEDPELSIRLRQAGWHIRCLDETMTIHDAAMLRFGQWWRRTTRGGHAFAELVHRHPDGEWHDYRRNCRRALIWGAILPLIGLVGLLFGLATGDRVGFAVFGAILLLTLAQIARLAVREMRRRPVRRAVALATFLTLGKYAEMVGMTRYHVGRLFGRGATLIEYKGHHAR